MSRVPPLAPKVRKQVRCPYCGVMADATFDHADARERELCGEHCDSCALPFSIDEHGPLGQDGERPLGHVAGLVYRHACGWQGVPALGGDAALVCPVCVLAPRTDAMWESMPRLERVAPQVLRRAASGVSRNAPCPCGSGRKAKKCCHG
jgi:hypothetical protein